MSLKTISNGLKNDLKHNLKISSKTTSKFLNNDLKSNLKMTSIVLVENVDFSKLAIVLVGFFGTLE